MSHHRITRTRALGALLLTALVALGLSACGGSGSGGGSGGGSATSLLRQTFSGRHKVNSGNLSFSLSVQPSGSSTLTKPITLSFGGPFQSRGTGKLPASDFAVSLAAQGHSGSLSIISTGTTGYVSLSGTSYQLPAASFQRLESSFSSIASSGTGSANKSTLSKLGINPLGWLSDPTVVGRQTIGGAQTTHVRARVNVSALLRDLSTFLQRASSLGVSGAGKLPTSLSAAEQQRIAAAVQHPTFDVWTGDGDKTVRQLIVGLSLPVTGQISALLGGMKSAGITLTLRYGDLNQPQTITAPSNVRPYSEFSVKLGALVQQIESSVASGALGGTGSTGSSGSAGSTGSTGTSGGAASATSAYSQCITAAGSDVAKMQKCASLLNGQG